MRAEILEIVSPHIQWTSFLASVSDILNRGITKRLDTSKMFEESPIGFLRVLGETLNVSTPKESIGDPALQRHINFTFLVVADEHTIFELLSKSTKNLSIDYTRTPNERVLLSVITGNMQEWVNTVLACCTGRESFDLRFLCDAFILHFEKGGFASLFAVYRKVAQPDGTFLLLERKK